MPIIIKPFTFAGNLAPLLTWLDANFDALYTLVNGGLDDPNIKTNAGIQQSKILNLVSALAAAPLLDGSRPFTGNIWTKSNGSAALRLTGTETAARDFLFAESGGELLVMVNNGTEAVPSWTPLYGFRNNGIPSSDRDVATKAFVDDRTSDLGIAEGAFDSSPDFTIGGPVAYSDLGGFNVAINLVGNHRVRVSTQLSGISNTVPTALISFRCLANGSVLGASQITVNGATSNASHSYFTGVIPAGGYNFQLQWKTDTGVATLKASGDAQARMQLEEMSR
jgi:hypothetical protein